MEFRLNERHIVALNFLLIAVLAYFAALSVNDIVAMRLTTPRPSVAVETRRTSSGVGNLSRGAYQEIVSRDIFNIALPPQPKVVVEEKIDLPYELVGVSTFNAGRAPYAILSDRMSQQTVYKLGENIPNAGKMVEVDKDRIIIDHNGKRVALELPREALPGPVMGMQPVPPPVEDDSAEASNDNPDDGFDPNVEDLGDNRYKIPRSTIDHSLGNMNQLLTQIRAIPNIQNGRTNGFSLSEVEPGSVFDEMGLQEGDVLQSVNGQTVADPGQAMQMMNALRNANSINIVVMRDGHPTTLTYQIQ